MQGLAGPKLIDCFVSGTDIAAGMDWRREIRSVLARSHVLVLLCSAPSKDWDWCLYEAGLYCRFEKAEKNQVSGVVCLFNPGQASPSPLADLQGVPAEIDKVRDFLNLLCHQTWKISDEWRQGALAPDIDPKHVDDAACAIERAFRLSASTRRTSPAIAWCCRCPSSTKSRTGSGDQSAAGGARVAGAGQAGGGADGVRRSLAISRRLAEQDPSNAGWQQGLGGALNQVGEVLQAQGKLEAARTAFEEVLAISRRLAEQDPSNAGWQQGLSGALNQVGDVLQAQGKLEAARTAFEEVLAISRRLAEQDPSNADWQQGLGGALNQVGRVLQAQGSWRPRGRRSKKIWRSVGGWRSKTRAMPTGNRAWVGRSIGSAGRCKRRASWRPRGRRSKRSKQRKLAAGFGSCSEVQSNNPQQSWEFDGEPPEAVIKEFWDERWDFMRTRASIAADPTPCLLSPDF